MTKLKFYDEIPTPHLGRRQLFVRELKKHPHKWAEYKPRNGRPHSPAAASVMVNDFPGVEAVQRGGKVYARWIGRAAR